MVHRDLVADGQVGAGEGGSQLAQVGTDTPQGTPVDGGVGLTWISE
jgi:hypothetical protein